MRVLSGWEEQDPMVLTAEDRRELDTFARFLAIQAWRMKELGETRHDAVLEAWLEVYGKQYGEWNKHEVLN